MTFFVSASVVEDVALQVVCEAGQDGGRERELCG